MEKNEYRGIKRYYLAIKGKILYDIYEDGDPEDRRCIIYKSEDGSYVFQYLVIPEYSYSPDDDISDVKLFKDINKLFEYIDKRYENIGAIKKLKEEIKKDFEVEK